MRVRRARPEDAPAIETLYRMLVVGDENIRVDPARIKALEQHEASHLFVLETDSGVRGTAFLTICLDAMYGFCPYGVVENIVVETSMRRAGGGRGLMSAIEQVARAESCTKLMLLSSAARVDAHHFFSRLGFDGKKKRGFVKYLNRSEERPPCPGSR
jgi:N-acetylglutamate synthase-like GNAT family acetyltransferase